MDLTKRMLLVLAIALISLSRVCLGADGEPVELKVMTYNIGGASPIPLGLPEIAKIAEQIKAENVDIVGLQEVDLWTNWEKWRSGLDM
ncbi:MAG TPA: endonuclease/exonuclease/phosphatase family protein, partial [Armatimonadota bacterium]|nr:endonuclease/exonuclease/phosphatase family protein [Armatimonadota bacterium]